MYSSQKELDILFEIYKDSRNIFKINDITLLLNEIREAVNNVNLVKKGKIQARPAKELLMEIENSEKGVSQC